MYTSPSAVTIVAPKFSVSAGALQRSVSSGYSPSVSCQANSTRFMSMPCRFPLGCWPARLARRVRSGHRTLDDSEQRLPGQPIEEEEVSGLGHLRDGLSPLALALDRHHDGRAG